VGKEKRNKGIPLENLRSKRLQTQIQNQEKQKESQMTSKKLSVPSPEELEQICNGFKDGSVIFDRDNINAGITIQDQNHCYDIKYTVYKSNPSNEYEYWKVRLLIQGGSYTAKYQDGPQNIIYHFGSPIITKRRPKLGEVPEADVAMIFDDLRSLAKIARQERG